ncbi:hypothetical protein CEXT_326351 [Caerostris extrusa]|uniref:Uncharacterized protein n=1 Tax=Caerostris extrusa TaxID=172846 RepID=A0AAV4UHP0_CAEEX|nr:hypothetical protein CEXT_326351 [Caerostris extrusa]
MILPPFLTLQTENGRRDVRKGSAIVFDPIVDTRGKQNTQQKRCDAATLKYIHGLQRKKKLRFSGRGGIAQRD